MFGHDFMEVFPREPRSSEEGASELDISIAWQAEVAATESIRDDVLRYAKVASAAFRDAVGCDVIAKASGRTFSHGIREWPRLKMYASVALEGGRMPGDEHAADLGRAIAAQVRAEHPGIGLLAHLGDDPILPLRRFGNPERIVRLMPTTDGDCMVVPLGMYYFAVDAP